MVKHYKAFLRWWLFAVLLVISFVFGCKLGVIDDIWQNDVTKISFLIMGLFSLMSIQCGYYTWSINRLSDNPKHIEHAKSNSKTGWFMSGLFLDFGMMGTLIGFLLIFGTTFAKIDFQNIATAQAALGDIATGMSTALYTTLVGLTASALLKIQYFNLEMNLKEIENEKQI